MLNLLNKTAEIKRKTIAQGDTGETTATWATVGTYKTRYAKSSGAGVTDGSYKTTIRDYLFFFEPSVDIILADEISIDEKIYKVKSVDTFDNDTIAHHVEVTAELVVNS